MKYKTSDLSKMLDVSANTIRRFAQKGYLSPERGDENQYRYFGDEDVEKITYISKYRKIGFGHDEIASMLTSNIFHNCSMYENKLSELDQEIARLQSLRHMLKDDIMMMKRIEQYGDEFIEMNSVSMYYVSYKLAHEIRNGSNTRKALHQFIYDFPEIEYIYIFRKDDILERIVRCEEAIGIRTKLALKRNLNLENESIECYPELPSVLRIVKLPIDFANGSLSESEEVKKILYDDFFAYMQEKGYRLAGDAIGIKVGFSKEDDKEMQYIILGMPVEKIEV